MPQIFQGLVENRVEFKNTVNVVISILWTCFDNLVSFEQFPSVCLFSIATHQFWPFECPWSCHSNNGPPSVQLAVDQLPTYEVTHSCVVWVANILSMWVQGCCWFLFLFPFLYLYVILGSLITPHLSYHMTLSTRLHFFDLSVELGFSDISGPILSSRYDSIVSTNVKSDLVVRAVHVTILIVTNVRSDLGGLNLISPEQFCEVDRRNFIIYFYSLGNWMTPAQAQSSQSVAFVSSTRVPFGPRFSIPIAGFSDSFVSGPQSRPRSVEAIRSGHQRWTQSTAIPWLSLDADSISVNGYWI